MGKINPAGAMSKNSYKPYIKKREANTRVPYLQSHATCGTGAAPRPILVLASGSDAASTPYQQGCLRGDNGFRDSVDNTCVVMLVLFYTFFSNEIFIYLRLLSHGDKIDPSALSEKCLDGHTDAATSINAQQG